VDADDIGPGDLFTLAPRGETEPCDIAAALVDAEDDFAHLREGEAVILFLMRVSVKEKAQKRVLGEMCLPRFQGSLGPVGTWLLAKACGEIPDFIMILDQEFWTQATPHQRKALVHHELLHAAHATDKAGDLRFTDDGRPIWALRAHDIEEFDAVVARYGAWLPDVQKFANALRDGGVV